MITSAAAPRPSALRWFSTSLTGAALPVMHALGLGG